MRSLGFRKAALSILLTTDAKIRKINRRYLNHDWATDVISFANGGRAIGRKAKGDKNCRSPLGLRPSDFLGDLVISLDTTKRQAGEYGNSFDYELAFYICHGILHLLGYDDRTPKEAERMDKIQERTLKFVIPAKAGIQRGSPLSRG